MSPINQLLETARRALDAQQVALGITGHNIANANTPGYSRQRPILQATPLIDRGSALIGSGVYVEQIQRMRDRFVDHQIRATNDSLGMVTTEHSILSQVEATFNEPSSSGLNSALSEFFQAWQALSVNPEDSVTRTALLQQGGRLSSTFRRLSGDITDVRTQMRDDLTTKVDQINRYVQDVADLNMKIVSGRASGQNTNDLQDMRDQRIDSLSSLANIVTTEDARGAVTVSLGGTVIASGVGALALKAVAGSPATVSGTTVDQLQVVTDLGGSTVNLAGGEAGGVLKLYNTTLADYLGRLDQLAAGVIAAVNQPHAAGYGLQSPPRGGIKFFRGNNAATMDIDLTDTSSGASPGSAVSLDNIVASSQAGESGNNDIALQIADAFDARPLTDVGGAVLLGGASIAQYYQNLIARVGSDVQISDSMTQSQEQVMSQLTQQRETVSGVSLDEEMTNMIMFQRAFDASARMVNVANEMFDTILNMV